MPPITNAIVLECAPLDGDTTIAATSLTLRVALLPLVLTTVSLPVTCDCDVTSLTPDTPLFFVDVTRLNMIAVDDDTDVTSGCAVAVEDAVSNDGGVGA
jgi:hypothetical protein